VRGGERAFLLRTMTAGRLRKIAARAACLVVLVLAVAGCASLGAALRTSSALQSAGYQDVGVNISSGAGSPSGGLISVTYSRGPTGRDQQDAEHAEKIVWDNYSGRFGAVEIVKESGGCVGPVCGSSSTEIAGATYAQLAAKLGPRPKGLSDSSASGSFAVTGGVLATGLALGVAVVVAAVVVLTVIIRRSRAPAGPARTAPFGPPGSAMWPPGSPPPAGPPAWPPGSPPPAGPPMWPPGSPPPAR